MITQSSPHPRGCGDDPYPYIYIYTYIHIHTYTVYPYIPPFTPIYRWTCRPTPMTLGSFWTLGPWKRQRCCCRHMPVIVLQVYTIGCPKPIFKIISTTFSNLYLKKCQGVVLCRCVCVYDAGLPGPPSPQWVWVWETLEGISIIL